MHAALRVVSIERGFDPREFGLIAFGGAGPLHANALGRLIHAEPVVIPAAPGVLSAFGFQVAEVQNEFARTYLKIAEDTPADDLRGVLTSLRDEAGEWLTRENVDEDKRTFRFYADCRYAMQDIQLPCELRVEDIDDGFANADPRAVRGRAPASLRVRPGRPDRDRHAARGRRQHHVRGGRRAGSPARAARRPRPSARSRCSSTASGTPPASTIATRSAPVTRCSGPAIVVQQDTTTVIDPGYAGAVDDYGNLIIRKLEGNR